jgi:hypothetical protein
MQPNNQLPQSMLPNSDSQSEHSTNPAQKNPIKIIFIALGITFLIAIILAVILSSSAKDKDEGAQQQAQSQNSSTGPTKATALDVENANNSINQSLGGLNDEQDFPPTQLDDKTLGL